MALVLAGGAPVLRDASPPAPTAREASTAVRPQVREHAEDHTVLQWNVAGGTLHGGSVTDGVVEAVVAAVVGAGADLVSLNEVCEQQFTAVRDGLAAAGWTREPGTSAFHPTMEGVATVCGGAPVGIAVLSARPFGDVWAAELPHDGSRERRALLCAGGRDTPRLRFCSTHVTTLSIVLPSGRPANVEQLSSVLDRVEASAAAGNTVIVAGDLNAQPHYRRLDGWYAPRQGGGDHGSYRELDDADTGNCARYGEWTATGPAGGPPPCGGGTPCTPGDTRGCAKIDHVFVREDRIVRDYSADALDIPLTCVPVPRRPDLPTGACSDHRPLVGTVTLLVRP